MADLSTHMYFASMMLKEFNIAIDDDDFFVGAVAPDSVRESDKFKELHLLEYNNEIQIQALHDFSNSALNSKNKSFYLGYLTHLFLDYYYDEFKDTIYIFQFELKEEIINAITEIKRYNHQLDIGPDSLDITRLSKSEFGYVEDAYKSLVEYLNMNGLAQEAPAPPGYLALMQDVKAAFLSENFSLCK